MAAAAVDVSYLSASYAVPEPALQSLLTTPTIELVQTLLVQIEAKAKEHDELRSEKLRCDVELENAVRNGETRARALKASADKALKDVDELRQKLSEEENARSLVETELQNTKSSASNSTSEVSTLESRIKSLEAQNRDTIALHEAKSAAHDRLAEDLSTQHQKFVNLRKQLSELEEKNQSLDNATTGAKFREQGLQQEIEMLKKNSDYYETELNQKRDDMSKLRKEKNGQIAELQRANTDASQAIDSLRRTETSQRKRMEELEQKIEQSLLRIQELQDDAAQQQESSQAELDNMRRLANLHEQSATTAKSHLQELRVQLDHARDTAATEIGQLQAEIDSEIRQKEAADSKIAELESQVETLEAQISDLRSAPIPSTPRRPMNGSFETPGRAGSPSFLSPARSRAGLSTTQLYAENTQLKAEIRALQSREEKSTATMNEMLAELENRHPEIEELRQENERLTSETGEISALLAEATAEKELARKESRKTQGDYQGIVREGEILRQQLRDSSAQLTLLLLAQQVREQGLETLTVEEQTYLQQVARNEVPDDQLDDSTDTGRLISRQLVLFKDTRELQRQNAELLRMIREVADRYEGSEAQARTNQIDQDHRELEQLREKVAQYEDEIQSLNIKSQSIVKERDIFRRIVTKRGLQPTDSHTSALFGDSTNGEVPTTPPPRGMQSVDQTPHSKEVAGYEKLVKDLQAHMDALRQESATDHMSLKQQADNLAKENSKFQTENMRLNNAVQLAQDRYGLLQNKLSLLQSENDEIQKRCDKLRDGAAQQDIRTQQAVQDLVEAKSMVDSLEREKMNLKSSRDLLKSIETRLEADNKALMEERGRLNKMITDLQNLRNEQELTEADNRRRLQSRTESLEAELQAAKRRLEEEIEDHKKATLRREYEQTENNRKIDDLSKALNNIRPELAAVKTERDQLQARVDELKVELRIAEERGQNLQPRPTPRANGSTGSSEEGLTRDEELSIEIAELRRNLEGAQQEVEDARAQIEQYKAIAQDAEDRLADIHDAQEELQQQTEQQAREKDEKIHDLAQRVEEISSELASTSVELSELRRKHEEDRQRYTQKIELHDSEVARLKDEADRYKETAALHQEDLKAQADIATRAQQNYESELTKHSDALNSLKKERDEHNQIKSEVAQSKAQAEAARTSLAEGEEHWAELRTRYERELTDLGSRYGDLEGQNKILHQQLENVSTQIAALKQNRVSMGGGDSDSTGSDADIQGLQDLITYLRREKDIVDVQRELAIQETKRLRQDLDHTKSQLEQTREKLIHEQQSQAQIKQSARNLESLENTIEQLNVYRESASTLRNEARQAQTRLADKSKEYDLLQDQIEPLKLRVQEVEGELAMKNGELEIVQTDRDHWQKRHRDVLQTYDRIDPKELEDLKNRMDTLQTERDQAQQQLSGLDAQVEAAKKATKEELENSFQERRQVMINQFKERSRELSGKLKEKDVAHSAIVQERDQLQQQLAAVEQDLERTRTARDEAITAVAASVDTTMGEEGQVDEGTTGISNEEKQALEERIVIAERRAIEESNRAVALHIEIQSLQSKVTGLENQAGELQQRIAGLNTELSEAQAQATHAEARVRELESQLSSSAAAPPTPAGETSEEVDRLKEELATAQKEVEDLRTRAATATVAADPIQTGVEDAATPIAEKIAQQVATVKAELEASVKDRIAIVETNAASKMDSLKDKCNKQILAKNETIKKLKEEHATTIDRLTSEHQTETTRLRQEAGATSDSNAAPAEKPTTDQVGPAADADVSVNGKAASAYNRSEIEALVKGSSLVKNVIQNHVTRGVEAKLQPAIAQARAEQEKLDAEKYSKELAEAQAKIKSEQVEKTDEAGTINIEGEDNARIDELVGIKVEEAKARIIKEADARNAAKLSLKDGMLRNEKAKIEVVQKAAEETPQRPVGEVWAVAKITKAKPVTSTQPAKPAPVPAAAIPSTATNTPLQGQANSISTTQPPTTAGSAQANGTTASPFSQPAFTQPIQGVQTGSFGQPSFGQSGQTGTFGRPTTWGGQNQPFQQPGQAMNQNRFPVLQNQASQPFGGSSGLAQPGFIGLQNQAQQNNTGNPRPNSPFNQPPQQEVQQPQQGGRGRGQENVGTGPATMRNILGQPNQSGIPRGGGTGIPRPGGRGQANQNVPNQANNATGGSQISRGGGRGGRGGRGGGQINTNTTGNQGQTQGQGQNSPRGMNPSAQGFQPGGGRGQKRGREDGAEGGDGGHQGGKRPRGGAGRGGDA